MKTIEKILIGAFLLGAAMIAREYYPQCMNSQVYNQNVKNGEVITTVIRSGNCYLMEKK